MSNPQSVATGTPRSSESAPKTPAWAPPKSPLPPHRLAKLANALGVSTPVHHYPTFPSSSPSSALSPATLFPPEPFRRSPSPSPSNMSFSTHAPTTSKFMIHVIPPLTIPHDSEFTQRSNFTPPPPTASGYHMQFRRGTLVPVHSTLHAQLWAIAREYALPSINGLVLYLVSNPRSPTLGGDGDDDDEPGPRLSEDIWKHLWTRVWKAEQRDETFASPISPGLMGLGLGIGARSTPHLPQDGSSPQPPSTPLKQLLTNTTSVNSDSAPFGAPYPSPSTSSSSTSEGPMKSPNRSDSLPSRTETPDTSLPSDADSARANSLNLPGLNSPGIIPILAKVEFDIDRKKATWYDPWLRSRKMNHNKRKKAIRTNSENGATESPETRLPPIALRLKGRAMTASPISMFESNGDENGYEPLEDEESDDESNYDDDATARIASTGKDPLADVFGDDADTWADMRDHHRPRRSINDPNVVDLALTGGELSALPDQDEENGDGRSDVDEVQEIMSTSLHRKNVPPPLNLRVSVSATELAIPSPQKSGNSSASTALPYLQGESPLNEVAIPETAQELEEDYKSLKSATDSEKRVGGVFEDLDLGLDPSEDFDDRRNSQYLFSEQLDEIERNLVQLSPRALKIELEGHQSLSFTDQQHLDLPPGAARNGDVIPPSPRKDQFDSHPETESISTRTSEEVPTAPRLAVNGVTANSSPPRKPSVSADLILPKRPNASEESPIIPLSPDPFGRYPSSPPEHSRPTHMKRNSSSYWDAVPVGVPTENLKKHRESLGMSISGYPDRPSTRSSRFSTDSTKDDAEEVVQVQVKGKGGVVSMKSLKRLWRKSNKNSVGNLPPPPPTPSIASAPTGSPTLATQQQAASKSTPELPLSSPMNSTFTYPSRPPSQQRLTPPIRPPRPSQEELEFPDIPDQLTIPLQPASGRPAPMPIIAAQMYHGRKSQDSGIDRLQFDQESPYPVTRRNNSKSSRPVSPAPMSGKVTPPPPNPTPPPQDMANANQKTSIRKSILKWKSAAQASAASNNDQNGNRQRKLSVVSLGGSNKSPGSYPDAIPPSPSIPEHFLNSRPSQASSHSHSHSSIDSKPDSLQSSPPRTSKSSATASPPPRTSKDSIPASLDESQFEIVSPKEIPGFAN
ncbi:hypothetical protein PM082_003464 [Marasmius tenuissimus]|nr:hypothetical protein PM082_003464 [Marasmius tenuissimus]